MFTSLIAVICSLFALSFGSYCTPDQWEGTEAIRVAWAEKDKHGTSNVHNRIYYDYTNTREALFLTLPSEHQPRFQTINLYTGKTGTRYTIDLQKDTCTKTPLSEPFQRACIVDGKFVGTAYLGLKGGFKVEVYAYERPNSTNILSVERMDDKTFAPVSEEIQLRYGPRDELVMVGFVNIVPAITNTTVFDVPEICKKSLTVHLPDNLPSPPNFMSIAAWHRHLFLD